MRSLSSRAEVVFFVLFCFPNHFHMQSSFLAAALNADVSWEPRLLFVVKLITVGSFNFLQMLIHQVLISTTSLYPARSGQ